MFRGCREGGAFLRNEAPPFAPQRKWSKRGVLITWSRHAEPLLRDFSLWAANAHLFRLEPASVPGNSRGHDAKFRERRFHSWLCHFWADLYPPLFKGLVEGMAESHPPFTFAYPRACPGFQTRVTASPGGGPGGWPVYRHLYPDSPDGTVLCPHLKEAQVSFIPLYSRKGNYIEFTASSLSLVIPVPAAGRGAV